MELKLFSFLNNSKNDNLIERFQILESIYRTSLEEEFKAQVRFALEKYEQVIWGGKHDKLYHRIQSIKV